MGNTEMAEMLNQYFASVFTVADTSTIPIGTGKSEVTERVELRTINIDKEKVLSKLLGLRADKSPGPDGLHPRVLKEVAAETVDPLVIIFQNSLDMGKVPVDWKMLFKKGGRQNMGNYRPVSLTSVVWKVLESIIKEAISGHLESQNIICQRGFMKGNYV